MFKYFILILKNLGGQTTKNVQGVRKIALKMLKVCLDRAGTLWMTCRC